MLNYFDANQCAYQSKVANLRLYPEFQHIIHFITICTFLQMNGHPISRKYVHLKIGNHMPYRLFFFLDTLTFFFEPSEVLLLPLLLLLLLLLELELLLLLLEELLESLPLELLDELLLLEEELEELLELLLVLLLLFRFLFTFVSVILFSVSTFSGSGGVKTTLRI